MISKQETKIWNPATFGAWNSEPKTVITFLLNESHSVSSHAATLKSQNASLSQAIFSSLVLARPKYPSDWNGLVFVSRMNALEVARKSW